MQSPTSGEGGCGGVAAIHLVGVGAKHKAVVVWWTKWNQQRYSQRNRCGVGGHMRKPGCLVLSPALLRNAPISASHLCKHRDPVNADAPSHPRVAPARQPTAPVTPQNSGCTPSASRAAHTRFATLSYTCAGDGRVGGAGWGAAKGTPWQQVWRPRQRGRLWAPLERLPLHACKTACSPRTQRSRARGSARAARPR